MDDFAGVAAPDDAVAGRNHGGVDAHGNDLLDFPADQRRKGQEYVGVVCGCFFHEHVLVYLIVKLVGTGEVLPEGVVGHEDFVFHHVGEHAVGPVKHRGFDEFEGAFAKFEFVACFDGLDFFVFGSVVFDKGIFASGGGDYGGVFGLFR